MSGYDAVLLASFGGPEGQDDVIPFLRNVTRGRGVPEERLEEVAHHYRAHGGISPINQQNRDLKRALEAELAARGVALPIVWGNRNWAPYFSDALREAHAAGHRSLLALVTSAYSSYSGVGQYREDFDRALHETGLHDELTITKVREFFDHPGFIAPFVLGITEAITQIRAKRADARTHIMFVTHSIPTADAERSGEDVGASGAYEAQHRAVAHAIMAALDRGVVESLALADAAIPTASAESPALDWSLVYQSRSGDPRTPWLEPDINEAIAELSGCDSLVIVPIGFVSDHMEVLWDLDNEAVASASERGIVAVRVPTPGVHPAFVAGLVDLILERVNDTPQHMRPHLTELGPWPDLPPQGAVNLVRR